MQFVFLFFSLLHISVKANVPVFVMLPLDVITSSLVINNQDKLKGYLTQLSQAGVKGVMSDCWWGLVEQKEKVYNFDVYKQLTQLVKDAGLTMHYVLSFHKCGGNVGDTCNYPLPSWVLDAGKTNDIWYKDQHGNRDDEYISLFADNAAVLGSLKRTPISAYTDFMSAFKSSLSSYMGTTITTVEVGVGPCGELRYPSYQLDKWSFCGVGEFQSYDSFALSAVKSAASSAGHPEWGTAGGPSNAGSYNSYPSQTGFFSDSGTDNYKSSYGKFYLNWYSSTLLSHGEKVLSAARNVYGSQVSVSLKVAGIHWWYFDNSHAAELTAGYYNIPGTSDFYSSIATSCSKYNATFDFTCLEMKDSEQPSECKCGPYELVQQTKQAALNKGAKYSGENALQRYDQTAYDTIKSQTTSFGKDISEFTYLRLTDSLMTGTNWNTFTKFVNDMKYL